MSERMKIRIHGDGPPQAWSITDAETGKRLPVTRLNLEADPEKCRAEITLYRTEIDVTTHAEVIRVCPRCKQRYEDSVRCQACNGSGRINGRRCTVCHGEPLTYGAFENLSNYVRTINLNVPGEYRLSQLDLSMVRLRDALAQTERQRNLYQAIIEQIDKALAHDGMLSQLPQAVIEMRDTVAELRQSLDEMVAAYVGAAEHEEDWGREEAEAEDVVVNAMALLARAGGAR